MNPQFEQPQGLRLPQPSLEPSLLHPGGEAQPPHEQQGPVPSPAIPPGAIPLPQQHTPTPPPASHTQPAAILAMAPAADEPEDSSLDEEWITKAKHIVELTHADPHKQSDELSRFKADYLKVRHNKIIKIAEDQAK